MTFFMHEYFSTEDLDFRNLIKFSLHFWDFSAFSYKLPNFHSNQTTKKTKTTLNGAVGPTRHPNKERGGKLPCSALPPARPARRRRVGRLASGAARAGPRAGLARPRPSRGAGGGCRVEMAD